MTADAGRPAEPRRLYPSLDLPDACSCRGGSTTRRSSSSARTRSSSRSAARATRRSWWPRGMLLKPGDDWFYPYYRDRALCLQLGVTPLEMFLEARRRRGRPGSGGRQMPSHWGHAAAQHRHAVLAHRHPVPAGGRLRRGGRLPRRGPSRGGPRRPRSSGDEVVYVSIGDGTTSEGEFWESLNTACNLQAPGRSSWSRTTATRSRCRSRCRPPGAASRSSSRSFPDLLVREVDGCDPLASLRRADARRSAYCRARKGPALVHAHVIRPYSHSLSDDESLYRSDERARGRGRRDPLVPFRGACSRRASPTGRALEALRAEVERGGERGGRRGPRAPQPDPGTVTLARLLAGRRPDVGALRHGARFPGRPHDDGRPASTPACTTRWSATRASSSSAQDVADASPRGGARRVQGQGRRLQGHLRPAERATAATASSTRRSPRPTSSAARSAWPRGA